MFSELVGRIFSAASRSQFEHYYGNVLLAHGQGGKPTADEAKRDFFVSVELNSLLG